MTRDELLVTLYNEERNKLGTLSKNYKPKEGHVEQWKDCRERVNILKQMIDELPKDEIIHNEATGYPRQDLIGTLEYVSNLYGKYGDSDFRENYVRISIMNSGNKSYDDEQLLKINYRIYDKWFKDGKEGKYEREKEERAKENKCTYIKVTVINGWVMKLKWINPRKKAAD